MKHEARSSRTYRADISSVEEVSRASPLAVIRPAAGTRYRASAVAVVPSPIKHQEQCCTLASGRAQAMALKLYWPKRGLTARNGRLVGWRRGDSVVVVGIMNEVGTLPTEK